MVYVYFVGEVKSKKKGTYHAIKIGIARNISKRIDAMQTGNSSELKLIAALPFEDRVQAEHAEKRIHHRFRYQKIRGEWFTNNINLKRLELASTWIDEDKFADDVPYFKEHCENREHFREI